MYFSDSVAMDTPPEDPQGAREWLAAKWQEFKALSPGIIDLQHRAALAAQAYEAQGDPIRAEAARLVIHELAKLQRVHHAVETWGEAAAGAVGLGAVQIPLGIAGVTVAALLVAWVFRKYAAQSEALELLEAGVLTPEQFDALDIMDPPGIGADVAGIAGGIGKWVLLVVLGLALYEASKRVTFQPNPPLILMGNPDTMSRNVMFLAYEHDEDGEFYIHPFEGDVHMDALEDGTVRIYHPDEPVWRDF